MTSTTRSIPSRPTRRAATGLAAVAAAAALAVAPVTTATAAAPAAPAGPTAPTAPTATAAAPSMTKVVLKVEGCQGCSFQASSYDVVGTDVRVWSAREKQPDARGRVTFLVRTDRTERLSVAVRAPWERRLDAVSQMVFTYRGDRPGDPVTVADARAARQGNACFGGTRAQRLVLGVRGYRAHFPGAGARATGAATFTTTAQPVNGYDYPVADGWSGAQEVPCYPS